MKKITVFLLVFVMMFTTACGGTKQASKECTTKIHFLCISKDNGAMDCILLESQGRFGLIDCGYWDQREQITNSMAALGVTQDNLDFIIGTHAHADHIGAMNFLVQNYNVERIYLMPFSADCLTEPEEWLDESWDNVMRTADKMGLPVVDTFEEGAGETPWIENTDESVADESLADESATDASTTDASAADESSAAESKAAESTKTESVKSESAKTESAKSESAKAESTKAESAKTESAKAESAKTESTKTESAKAESAKTESAKAESTKTESAKADSTKAESTKTESAKAERTKAESAKADSAEVGTKEKTEAVSESRPSNHYTADPHFTFGDARIDIYNYSQDYLTEKVVNANDTSLVIKVTAGGHTALLTGDLSNAGPNGNDPGYDEEMIADQIGHVDLLKLSHHGYGWYDTNTVRDLKKFHADYLVQTGATNMLFTDKPDSYDEVIREVKKGAVYVSTFWYDRRVIGGDGLYAITYDMKDMSSNVPEDVSILAVNRDGESVMFKGGKLAGFDYDEKTYLSNGSRNDYGTVEVDGIFYEIDNNSRILKVFD